MLRHSLFGRSQFLVMAVLAMVVISLGMAGCAAFAPAQSTQEKIAYAKGAHEAVVVATTQALNARAITSADAQHVLDAARDARVFLDASSTALAAGDTKTAEGQLALATAIIYQLQTYLSKPK